MHSKDYDFFKMFYDLGSFTDHKISEAVKVQVLTPQEYQDITGKPYTVVASPIKQGGII